MGTRWGPPPGPLVFTRSMSSFVRVAAIAWVSTAAASPASCASWPSAELPLVSATGAMSGETASFASLPAADATIVGLYFGD